MARVQILATVVFSAALGASVWPPNTYAQAQTDVGAQSSAVKPVGKVKAVSGNTITLATDSGTDLAVTVQDSTRLLRMAPGQKDLKDATPIQLPDVQVGDRILVRGKPGNAANSLVASAVLVMKAADVSQKQEQERQDWQKRGLGGLVSAVDPVAHTVTISTSGLGQTKKTVIQTNSATVFRRYAANSIRYDDAKPGTFDDIKVGDQLRARGDKNADGSELTAQEVISGTFLNIPGTVVSADAGSNTLVVTDLLTKKPVTVQIAPDSQLHKLPAMVAQRIAFRLKGGASEPGQNAGDGGEHRATDQASGGAPAGANGSGGYGRPGGTGGGGGTPDFQQILNHMPAVTVGELQKGDAVMIVATPGPADGSVTAITLLSGVEPILSASPSDNRAAMALSPWNLASSIGDAAQ